VRTSAEDPAKPPPLEDLALAIDRDAEIPIGVQLTWAIRTQIGEGRRLPNERLPALRDLAAAIGVNVNTVRAVYARLESEGLIESQHGSGTFVAASPAWGLAARHIARDAAREARAAGTDPRDVAAALYVSGLAAGTTGEEASRRQRLRTQIAALERTASEIEAEHPGLATRLAAAEAGGPSMLDAEELETMRRGMVHRLAALQAAIDRKRADEDRPGDPAPRAHPVPKRKAPSAGRAAGRPATA
jgi:DNA-binding transcriptional regulator YhcF (GntR family)